MHSDFRNEWDSYIKMKKMKKQILIIILATSTLFASNGQTIDEALKYSQVFYSGTARFQSMGGAFTALGGDLSSLSLNPAGLGVFRSMEISITPRMDFINSSSDFGEQATDNLYHFSIGQLGIVLPLLKTDGDGLKGFTVGYSYNKLNNFNSSAIIRGVSNNSSMADYWLNNSEGTYFADLTGAEGIAFDSWLFDTIPGTGGTGYGSVFSEYGNNANSTYGQTIRRLISGEGYTAEHAFSAAVNLDDKFYFGATFGLNIINNYSRIEHLEADYDGVIFDFKDFTYTDVVETQGRGFAFKLGAIIRPVNMLRLGVSFHAPVIYRLNEYYYDAINTNFDNGDTYNASNDPFRFSYTLTTPLRANVGAALQLGKMGLISAGYEYVDYRMARFSRASDDYDYYYENEDIKNIFRATNNLRIGGELRLSNSYYLRGGYSLYGSAFAKGEDNENNYYTVVSGGAGFRQSNMFVDISYSRMTNTQKYFMYNHPDVTPADLTYNNSSFSATIGFRF